MKRIIKSETEQKALIDYRTARTIDGKPLNYTWKDFSKPWKDECKKYLLQEQGYLCAYCMKSISLDKMKIEHLNPRHNCKTEDEKLTNKNLVAVCLGITDAEIHCDTNRGNLKPKDQLLSISPTMDNPNCEELTYFESGQIKSTNDNAIIENDLNKKLNLNCNPLITARNATEQGFIDGLITKAFNGEFNWTIDRLQTEMNRILQLGVDFENRHFSEYCLIEVAIIKAKIQFQTNSSDM